MKPRYRYVRRFTYDLVIDGWSDRLEDLTGPSDYRVHVLDRDTNEVVWQNVPSERYGSKGVSGE